VGLCAVEAILLLVEVLFEKELRRRLDAIRPMCMPEFRKYWPLRRERLSLTSNASATFSFQVVFLNQSSRLTTASSVEV
jgi:hypothetical protein